MKFLIKAATIIDPTSKHHNQKVDLLIDNKTIKEISSSIKGGDGIKEITFENLHISQGWFDSSVSFGEPGFEERETIAHGVKVAATSGFTSIALQPNTQPVVDTSTSVSFVKKLSDSSTINIYPIGALTEGSKGENMSEMFDMKKAGAIAFGDYKKAIKNPNLLKIALLYAQNFDGLVLSYPQDNDIAGVGNVNEEQQSTLLGLKGIPAIAEELQIVRDLFLLEYTKGKLHIPTISTAKSVDLIRDAKAKGLQVSCSVSVHHLSLTDNELTSFNSNFKVQPPLRTQSDVDALIKGVKDGTIDAITSDHNPLNIETKKVEFDNAKYGTIGLESSFGILNNILTTKKTIEMLTAGKSVFGIDSHPIAPGNIAELSFFNPDGNSSFTTDDIRSTSKNSAFIGKPIKGKVYGIFANGKTILNKQ